MQSLAGSEVLMNSFLTLFTHTKSKVVFGEKRIDKANLVCFIRTRLGFRPNLRAQMPTNQIWPRINLEIECQHGRKIKDVCSWVTAKTREISKL